MSGKRYFLVLNVVPVEIRSMSGKAAPWSRITFLWENGEIHDYNWLHEDETILAGYTTQRWERMKL